MTKKACKKCKIITEKEECPICGGKQFSENIKGRVIIINAGESEIAKKLKIMREGEYAIKIR